MTTIGWRAPPARDSEGAEEGEAGVNSPNDERFKEAPELWLYGEPDPYGEPDASNMDYSTEYISLRCDGDLNVSQARALRDWLNKVIP